MTQETVLALTLFAVVWLITFVPCWFLLSRLMAMSVAEKPPASFWAYFVAYRVLILAPYIVLLVFGRESLPSLLQALIVGLLLTGTVLSFVRFFLRDRVVGILWWVYGFCYDGLLYFRPYTKLVEAVATTSQKAVQAPSRVLELGCGTGNVVKALEGRFPSAEIVAVDNSSSMLGIARKKKGRARYEQADILEFLESSSGTYDLVVMQNSLYAVTDREKLWRLLDNAVTPRGAIVITNSDKPGSGTIIKEHLTSGGRRIDLLRPRLLMIGIIDNFISQLSRTGTFSFITADELAAETRDRFVMSEPTRVYGGVNILFVLQPKQGGTDA